MNLEIRHSETILGITIEAIFQSEPVGLLSLTGEFAHAGNKRFVRSIIVAEEYQRRGVATRMWKYAKAHGFNPTHDLSKTHEGKAWAEKVGS